MKEKFEAPDGSYIEVSKFGGHILSWVDNQGNDSLYLSPKAIFDNKTPIRGGIPICFPKFGNFGQCDALKNIQSHGFLRQAMWDVTSQCLSRFNNKEGYQITLSYQHDKNSDYFSIYPYKFTSILTIIFNNNNLHIQLEIKNMDSKLMPYTLGFHPYFSFNIDDDAMGNMLDLSATTLDNTNVVFHDDNLKITQETNLIFRKIAKLPILIRKHYELQFSCKNLSDLVIWNPYNKGAIKDLEIDSYKNFICIEPVAINQDMIIQPTKANIHNFHIFKA